MHNFQHTDCVPSLYAVCLLYISTNKASFPDGILSVSHIIPECLFAAAFLDSQVFATNNTTDVALHKVCTETSNDILCAYLPAKRLSLLGQNAIYKPKISLWMCCRDGLLQQAKTLLAVFGETIVFENGAWSAGFFIACENGHIEVSRWLVEILGPEKRPGPTIIALAMLRACHGGQFDVLMWLESLMFLLNSKFHFFRSEHLRNACAEGRFEIAKWLRTHFEITMGHSPTSEIAMFTLSCEKGNLNVAEWIFEEFNLTKDVARAAVQPRLFIICARGHLRVLRWLYENIGFGGARLEHHVRQAILCAAKYGQDDVVDWISGI